MSSSVGAVEEKLGKLRRDVGRGEWPKVFETIKKERALRTANITGTGDSVLHMALSDCEEKVVSNMVDFLVLEETTLKSQKNKVNVTLLVGDGEQSLNLSVILGAENDRKNTPLHLAATMGNVEMCRKISSVDPSLIARRNIAGETPLFLAALYGNKEAFLWLHYQYMEGPGVSSIDFAHCIRDNDDTILHCAIGEGHFDVAIEIVHLYKDHMKEMMRRNKEGLSPLHLLASKRSAFKTTALLELPILGRPIYCFLRIEKKKQATSREELEQREHEPCLRALSHALINKYVLKGFFGIKKMQAMTRAQLYEKRESKPCVLALTLALMEYVSNPNGDDDEEEESSLNIILYLLSLLTLFLLIPLGALEYVFVSAERWSHQIRKMKEKHTWSLQIMNELLQHASDEDMSEIISRTALEQLSRSLKAEDDDGT